MITKKLINEGDVDDLVLVLLAESIEYFDGTSVTKVAHAGLRVLVNPHKHYMVWGDRMVTVLPWQYRISREC